MNRKKQNGLSLVELMIALAISAFLVAGLIYVFLGSKQAYRTGDALGRVQESGRFALEIMSRDLQQAGYRASRGACGGDPSLRVELLPCPSPPCVLGTSADGLLDYSLYRIAVAGCLDNFTGDPIAPVPNHCQGLLEIFAPVGNALQGHQASGTNTWSPAAPTLNPPPLSGTDIISVRYGLEPAAFTNASPGAFIRIVDHVGASGSAPAGSGILRVNEAEVACPATPLQACIETNVIAVAVDAGCNRAAAFEVTSVSGTGILDIAHGSPANRSEGLGANFDGGILIPANHRTFPSNPVRTVTYYLAAGANGQPALFRSVDFANGEELVDGVEDLQLEFLRQGGLAYETADAIEAAGAWADVSAVHVRFLTVSRWEDQDNVVTEPQHRSIFYPVNPADPTEVFPDRRLRQVFSSTVAVRNNLLE